MNYIQRTSLAIVWVFLFFSFVFISLRIFTRTVIKKTRGHDDGIICLAWVINLAASILYTISVAYGTGKEQWELNQAEEIEAKKWEVIVNGVIVHTWSWPKLSVAILLIRIFQPGKWIKLHLLTLAIICILTSCILTILQYVQCTPVSRNWDVNVAGTCWSTNIYVGFSLFAGSFSAALDLYYALFPLPILWKVIQENRKRISLCCTMSLGVVACAVGICKTIAISKRSDIIHNRAYLDMWNQIEGNCVMIAATVPTLLPLFRSIRRHVATHGNSSESTVASPLPDLFQKDHLSPYNEPRSLSSATSDEKSSNASKKCRHDASHKHSEFQFGPGYGGIEFVLHSRPSMEADVEAGRAIQRTQDITVIEETRIGDPSNPRKQSLVELGLGDLPDLEKGFKPTSAVNHEGHEEHG